MYLYNKDCIARLDTRSEFLKLSMEEHRITLAYTHIVTTSSAEQQSKKHYSLQVTIVYSHAVFVLSVRSYGIVKSQCDGKNRCYVRASNSVFGDPCYGTYKYLQVDYVCFK